MSWFCSTLMSPLATFRSQQDQYRWSQTRYRSCSFLWRRIHSFRWKPQQDNRMCRQRRMEPSCYLERDSVNLPTWVQFVSVQLFFEHKFEYLSAVWRESVCVAMPYTARCLQKCLSLILLSDWKMCLHLIIANIVEPLTMSENLHSLQNHIEPSSQN